MEELIDLLIRGKRSLKMELKESFWRVEEATAYWYGMTYGEMQKGIRSRDISLHHKISCALDMKKDLLKAIKAGKITSQLGVEELFLNPIDFLHWGMTRLRKNKNGVSGKFLQNIPVILFDYILRLNDPLEILKTLRKGTKNFHQKSVIVKAGNLCLRIMRDKQLEMPPPPEEIKRHPEMKSLLTQIDRERGLSSRLKDLSEIQLRQGCKDVEPFKRYSSDSKYKWIQLGIQSVCKRPCGRPARHSKGI